MRYCTVEECPRVPVARGYCNTHYNQVWRNGTLQIIQPKIPGRSCDREGCLGTHYGKGLCKQHWSALPENIAKRVKWGKDNKKSHARSNSKWRSHNLDSGRASRAERRAKERAGGSFSVWEWQQLLERHNYSCFYCDGEGNPLTIDHVLPLSKGGLNSITNIVPACGSCNYSKRDMTIREWRPEIADDLEDSGYIVGSTPSTPTYSKGNYFIKFTQRRCLSF